MSPSPSSSPSTSSSTSSSRRRVTFMDSDTVVSLPLHTTSETVSESISPGIILSAPPSPSLNSTTSTLSTSSPYTPLPNSESIQEAQALDAHGLILHPCLTTSNPIQWNMLIDPQTPRLHALKQFGDDPMTDDAFPDSISKIQINCNILPWPIIIKIKQDDPDHTPRIEDVSESIYVSLYKQASPTDFDDQLKERQHQILKAYRRRCRQSSVAKDALRRIDFLEGQTMFLGLSPGNSVDELDLHVGQVTN